MAIIPMKHSNINYLFAEGSKALFKHGFMSFAAICITVACLVIVCSFGLITYNLTLIVDEVQEQNRILVCINEDYTEAESKNVGSQINLIENVANAQFISRQQALESYIGQADESIFEGLSADTMRDQFSITLVDNGKVEETVAELREVPGVASIYYDPEIANAMTTIRDVLSVASISVTIVLMIVSLLIISNTIKLAMMDRREEIAIMKMVGATNAFIRFPFIIEGFFLGLFSSIISFFLEGVIYEAIRMSIESTSLDFIHIIPYQSLILPMAVICIFIGFMVGILGSVFSIGRYLKV